MGIKLMPWQDIAARYLTALGQGDRHLYREVCIVVARQNGKTHLMRPLIVGELRKGKRILHIAQTRDLPRQMFNLIAGELDESLFLKQRGKGGKMHTVWPRHGAGQEEILLANGGSYRIAAASRGGARGQTTDLVIIDELREMMTNEVIDAAEPTLRTSPDSQMVYLSNAGSDLSVILNSVRERAGEDPNLAYLEWSADPERLTDDRKGWGEANPSIGHIEGVEASLESSYLRHKLSGTLASFETESLCRWVVTMRESLVAQDAWLNCAGDEGKPIRPVMAVSIDPDRTRAAAAIAWQRTDGKIGLRLLRHVEGLPIDPQELGADLQKTAQAMGITRVGFDPLTDGLLAKFFRKPEPWAGQKFAGATSQFVNAVTGSHLRWADADGVTDDLTWTSRKPVGDEGAFEAVRSKDDRPIPASLAAIRAVAMASGPRPELPRIG